VAAGVEVAHASTDVRRRADLSALVDLAKERFGRLDVLVNNAGIMPISPLDDLRVDDWEDMIDTNLRGVLYGVGAALPVFRDQGSGHVVNLASTAAFTVLPRALERSLDDVGEGGSRSTEEALEVAAVGVEFASGGGFV